jgi:spermidine/putrescine transport system substrate-binding protein
LSVQASVGRKLTRRELLQVGAGAGLAAYGLAGCTVQRPIDKAGAADAISPKIDGDLLIFNWATYMDPALQKGFADKYGVNVTEANFDSLEAMLVKLRSGARYDLIFPSSEYVVRLREEGFLHQFDRSKLRHADGIVSYFDNPWYDPNGNHSVPYTLYTTGICWRDDVVSGMTGSWNDLVNPTADGRAFILDDFQEAIGEANLINGFTLNDENSDDIARSKDTLLSQKPHMRGFSTNSVQNLTSGLAVLHHAWNGDIVNVRNQVNNPEHFKFETCKEGVPVGSDAISIPVNARSPGTALLFIDWLLQPEHAAQNVAWNGYPQPVDGGRQEFSKLVKDEPTIDITIEQLKTGDEFRFATPAGRELWTQTWTEVKV